MSFSFIFFFGLKQHIFISLPFFQLEIWTKLSWLLCFRISQWFNHDVSKEYDFTRGLIGKESASKHVWLLAHSISCGLLEWEPQFLTGYCSEATHSFSKPLSILPWFVSLVSRDPISTSSVPEGADFYGVHRLSFAFQLLVEFDQWEALTENVENEESESFSIPLTPFFASLHLADVFSKQRSQHF